MDDARKREEMAMKDDLKEIRWHRIYMLMQLGR